MKDISLNQFGSVLTYAIDLENDLIKFYKTDKLRNNFTDLHNEFEDRINSVSKRIKKIERSRRENITEITLEPIEGLNVNDYYIKMEKFDEEEIRSNHERMCSFYGDSGPKINVLETQRLFRKCLSDHQAIIKN